MKSQTYRRLFLRGSRGSCTVEFPTRDQVESLRVGDVAPDCFGGLSPVVEIFARGDDIEGRAFVCYYSSVRGTLKVSNSMKQDTVARGVRICDFATSHEITVAERCARETGAGLLPD